MQLLDFKWTRSRTKGSYHTQQCFAHISCNLVRIGISDLLFLSTCHKPLLGHKNTSRLPSRSTRILPSSCQNKRASSKFRKHHFRRICASSSTRVTPPRGDIFLYHIGPCLAHGSTIFFPTKVSENCTM